MGELTTSYFRHPSSCPDHAALGSEKVVHAHVKNLSSAAMVLSAPALWTMYEAMADANSLWTDVATSSALNVASDSIAQAAERTPLVRRTPLFPSSTGLDVERVVRFGAFGAADGAVSHAWFAALDSVVGDDGTLTETCVRQQLLSSQPCSACSPSGHRFSFPQLDQGRCRSIRVYPSLLHLVPCCFRRART